MHSRRESTPDPPIQFRPAPRTLSVEPNLLTARDPELALDHDPLELLVRRIAGRDERALQELYERTSARVHGLTLSILRDRPRAEEALVDVYDQIWRQSERFDPAKGSVSSWIATLARTRAIDLRRRAQRRRQLEVELGQVETQTLADVLPGPLAATVGEERAEIVAAALASLPREQRRAIEAAFFGGLSHSEVAAALGQPLGTVKTRIRSALATLRTRLAFVEGEFA